jgi:hypothetical protein
MEEPKVALPTVQQMYRVEVSEQKREHNNEILAMAHYQILTNRRKNKVCHASEEVAENRIGNVSKGLIENMRNQTNQRLSCAR